MVVVVRMILVLLVLGLLMLRRGRGREEAAAALVSGRRGSRCRRIVVAQRQILRLDVGVVGHVFRGGGGGGGAAASGGRLMVRWEVLLEAVLNAPIVELLVVLDDGLSAGPAWRHRNCSWSRKTSVHFSRLEKEDKLRLCCTYSLCFIGAIFVLPYVRT